MSKKMLLFPILICVMLFIGCEKKYVSCNTIVTGGIEKCDDFPKYSVIDRSTADWEQTYEVLYEQYADDVKDFYYVHSQEEDRDDEIVVIRFNTAENADKMLSSMERRKEARLEDVKNHLSDEAAKMVENTVIKADDVYVFYISCNNPTEIYDYCRSIAEEK